MLRTITYFYDHEDEKEPIIIQVEVEGKANKQTVQEAQNKADAILIQRGLDPDLFPDVDIDMGETINW